MSSNQSHKAVVFGSISVDKIINKHGTFSDVLGGSAAYALLANKVKTCDLVGVVGNDFSNEHFQLLSKYSATTNNLTRGNGKTFCWAGQYVDDFSSRKTLYVEPGVSDTYLPHLSNDSKECSYLMLGNTAPHLQKKILSQIKGQPYTLLDTFKLYIDTANEELKSLLKDIDVFCINFNEAKALSEQDGSNLFQMAQTILNFGPKSLIIKNGEHGSCYFDRNNKKFKIKAFPVKKVIDTTGAGDAYLGGILMAKMQGMHIYDSMKVGAIMASFCIEGVGVEGLLKFSNDEFQKRLDWINRSHTS